LNQTDPADTFSLNDVIELLTERQGFLDGVVITGGEPTLREELPSACEQIKQLGYPLKLDTNGSRPEVIRALLSANAIDYIAMDIKSAPENYVPLICSNMDESVIRASIQLILNSGIAHEFRTTCIHPLVSHSIIREIADLINGANLYVLQQFHMTDVLNPTFCREVTRRFDMQTLDSFRSEAAPKVKKCIIR